MSRSINGRYTLAYPNLLGFQELTSDSITDKTTGHTVFYDITDLETHSSLGNDLTLGTTNANTININSGSTTYNNNEIISLKSNSTGAMQWQCLNVSGSVVTNKAVLILNTTYNNQSLYIPCNYTEIGNVASGGVQIGDGTNAGSTNIYGIVSLKNATDSSSYTSTNCTNIAGGLSVYKALNVGGNITSLGTLNIGAVSSSGTITTGTLSSGGVSSTSGISVSSLTDSTSTSTGSIITAGGVGIAKNLYVGGSLNLTGALVIPSLTTSGAVNCGQIVSSGSISGTTITGTGNLTVGANGITCGNITNSGVILASNTTESTTTSTGAIICSGGVAIAKNLNVGGVITALGLNTGSNTIYGGAFNTANNMTCGSITNSGNYGGSGFINIGTNSMTCGAITSSGAISCGTLSPQNVLLPTSGGTATALNYYESNVNFPMMFQGAGGGGTTTTVNLTISRMGNIVNIIMPIVNINSNGSYITTNSAYYLPTRFRPSAVYIDYCMHSMNIATYLETGMINVCNTGVINICKSSSSVSFGVGTGSGTANVFHMVYSV